MSLSLPSQCFSNKFGALAFFRATNILLVCGIATLAGGQTAKSDGSRIEKPDKLQTASRSDSILLKSRIFVPEEVEKRAAEEKFLLPNTDHATAWHGIIQFESSVLKEQNAVIAILSKSGVKVLNFIPSAAVAAYIPAHYDPITIPGVRWVGDFQPSDKLIGNPVGPSFLVGFHPDLAIRDVERLLALVGAKKLEPGFTHPENIALVSMPMVPATSANLLAALDEVAWIKQAPQQLLNWKGEFVYFCPGAMTPLGPLSEAATTKASIAYRTATRGQPIHRYRIYPGSDGWDGAGQGSAMDLRYYFGQSTNQLSVPDQHSYIASALNTWAKYAQIAFAETASASQGRSFDISFLPHNHDVDGAGGYDTPIASGAIAHAFPPGRYPNPIAGDVHFDADYVGANNDGGWARAGVLYTIALHESGHSLGLDHSEFNETVMSSLTTKTYTDLIQDDINGIRALYATPTAPTPAPSISGFSPTEGYPPYDTLGQAGTTVTITGLDLASPTQATFNGLIAPIISASSNSIVLVVPKGASTGRITIDTAGGRAITSTNFKVKFTNNDMFINRQKLKGPSGAVTGNTAAATRESGEPYHAGVPGAHSVWFNYKIPDGISYITLKTKANAGSGFNTTLAVYQGSAINALTLAASNDDNNGTIYSSVTFQVAPGQGYKIAIDGNGNSAGDVVLKWNTGTTSDASNAEIVDGYVPPPYYPDPSYPPGTIEP